MGDFLNLHFNVPNASLLAPGAVVDEAVCYAIILDLHSCERTEEKARAIPHTMTLERRGACWEPTLLEVCTMIQIPLLSPMAPISALGCIHSGHGLRDVV